MGLREKCQEILIKSLQIQKMFKKCNKIRYSYAISQQKQWSPPKKFRTIPNVILILYDSLTNKKLILSELHFEQIVPLTESITFKNVTDKT